MSVSALSTEYNYLYDPVLRALYTSIAEGSRSSNEVLTSTVHTAHGSSALVLSAYRECSVKSLTTHALGKQTLVHAYKDCTKVGQPNVWLAQNGKKKLNTKQKQLINEKQKSIALVKVKALLVY